MTGAGKEQGWSRPRRHGCARRTGWRRAGRTGEPGRSRDQGQVRSHERSLADAAALRGVFPGGACNATPVRTYVTPTSVCATASQCGLATDGFRQSTRTPDAQRDALAAAGCDQVLIDRASGKLARLGRSLKHLIAALREPLAPRCSNGALPGSSQVHLRSGLGARGTWWRCDQLRH